MTRIITLRLFCISGVIDPHPLPDSIFIHFEENDVMQNENL